MPISSHACHPALPASVRRFDVTLCTDHCCAELAAYDAAMFDVPAINAVFGGLSPGMSDSITFAGVTARATERLLQLFGDMELLCSHLLSKPGPHEGVMNLLQLEQPSFIALLSSDSLMARKENSVLVVACFWVARSRAASGSSNAQLRSVAAAVRLSRLTPTFLFDVLPQLRWLTCTTEERAALLLFSAAGGRQAALSTDWNGRQRSLNQQGRLVGCPAWYLSAPRKSCEGADELQFTWAMTAQELQAHVASGEATSYSPIFHHHGFAVETLLASFKDGDAPTFTTSIGCYIAVMQSTSVLLVPEPPKAVQVACHMAIKQAGGLEQGIQLCSDQGSQLQHRLLSAESKASQRVCCSKPSRLRSISSGWGPGDPAHYDSVRVRIMHGG